MFSFETITAPTFAPVTSADMLQFLHLNDDAEAALLDQFVSGASDLFTVRTGVVLCASTLRLRLDKFPTTREVTIPRGPVSAVSLVEYLDTDGTWQTLTGWTADTVGTPARVILPTSLPALHATQKPTVRVTFAAGYASASAIPALALVGVKLLASDWYNDRSLQGTPTDRWLALTSRFDMGIRTDWNQ